jgi:hypothetical protein
LANPVPESGPTDRRRAALDAGGRNPEEAEVIADSLLKLIGKMLVLLTYDTVDW